MPFDEAFATTYQPHNLNVHSPLLPLYHSQIAVADRLPIESPLETLQIFSLADGKISPPLCQLALILFITNLIVKT